jgi:hypothetical protein
VEKDKKKIFWFNSQQKGLSYPPNSIIQYWGNEASYTDLDTFSEPVILSTFDYLYLDCGTGNQLGGEIILLFAILHLFDITAYKTVFLLSLSYFSRG